MAIVSLAGLLKSSTVLWMLGVSYHQPKEHRDLSHEVICSSSYNYGYQTCDDLFHYVTPSIPEEASSYPDFIGNHPFAYKFIYGDSIDKIDSSRIAVAKKCMKI